MSRKVTNITGEAEHDGLSRHGLSITVPQAVDMKIQEDREWIRVDMIRSISLLKDKHANIRVLPSPKRHTYILHSIRFH